ncbi:MAG: hypothetical protein HQM02_09815 [Magnetococcales bacterium]|nr:hypothetical protein [Magnetococcales bacterium]
MNTIDKELMSRRKVLIRMLSLGLLAGVGPILLSACGGAKPKKLEAGINQLEGHVLIDGRPARTGMEANNNSLIETGPDAMLALVLGKDAFLIRENTKLQFNPPGSAQSKYPLFAEAASDRKSMTDTPNGPAIAVSKDAFGFTLESGKVLSVFAGGRRLLRTPELQIGIRGTGVYLESAIISGSENSYICTCYGTIDIQSRTNPSIQETIVSKHHDNPRSIIASQNHAKINPAQFVNHTDAELVMINALVGRTPPFIEQQSIQPIGQTPNLQPIIQAPINIPTAPSMPH